MKLLLSSFGFRYNCVNIGATSIFHYIPPTSETNYTGRLNRAAHPLLSFPNISFVSIPLISQPTECLSLNKKNGFFFSSNFNTKYDEVQNKAFPKQNNLSCNQVRCNIQDLLQWNIIHFIRNSFINVQTIKKICTSKSILHGCESSNKHHGVSMQHNITLNFKKDLNFQHTNSYPLPLIHYRTFNKIYLKLMRYYKTNYSTTHLISFFFKNKQPAMCVNSLRPVITPPAGDVSVVSPSKVSISVIKELSVPTIITKQTDETTRKQNDINKTVQEDDVFPYPCAKNVTVRIYKKENTHWWNIILAGFLLFLYLNIWLISTLAPGFICYWLFQQIKGILSLWHLGPLPDNQVSTELFIFIKKIIHLCIDCSKSICNWKINTLGLISKFKDLSFNDIILSLIQYETFIQNKFCDIMSSMSFLGHFSLYYIMGIIWYNLSDIFERPVAISPYPSTRKPENAVWSFRWRVWMLETIIDWFGSESAVIFEDYREFLQTGRGGRGPNLVCYHPHGIFSLGMLFLSTLPEFEGYKVLGAAYLRRFCPLFRFIFDQGYVTLGNATRHKVIKSMKNQEQLMLVPGGLHEASLTEFAKEKIYLKRRKGFIRYALQYGYSLTPVYSFGENLSYCQFTNKGTEYRFKLNFKGIPTVAGWGCLASPFGMLPKRYPKLVIIGKPVKLPQIDSPTDDDIKTYQDLYLSALQRIYSTYAESYYRLCQQKHGLKLLPDVECNDQDKITSSNIAPVLQVM